MHVVGDIAIATVRRTREKTFLTVLLRTMAALSTEPSTSGSKVPLKVSFSGTYERHYTQSAREASDGEYELRRNGVI